MKEAKEGRILRHCGLIYGRLNTLDVLEVSSVRQNRRKQHSPGLLADELETCSAVNGIELSPGVHWSTMTSHVMLRMDRRLQRDLRRNSLGKKVGVLYSHSVNTKQEWSQRKARSSPEEKWIVCQIILEWLEWPAGTLSRCHLLLEGIQTVRWVVIYSNMNSENKPSMRTYLRVLMPPYYKGTFQ